jgi:hypothetical protein
MACGVGRPLSFLFASTYHAKAGETLHPDGKFFLGLSATRSMAE